MRKTNVNGYKTRDGKQVSSYQRSQTAAQKSASLAADASRNIVDSIEGRNDARVEDSDATYNDIMKFLNEDLGGK